jgi:hypothetical protein
MSPHSDSAENRLAVAKYSGTNKERDALAARVHTHR